MTPIELLRLLSLPVTPTHIILMGISLIAGILVGLAAGAFLGWKAYQWVRRWRQERILYIIDNEDRQTQRDRQFFEQIDDLDPDAEPKVIE